MTIAQSVDVVIIFCYNSHISVSQNKLQFSVLFESLYGLPKFRVIASQCAHWRGNPLQISGMSMGIPTSGLTPLLGMTSVSLWCTGKINYNIKAERFPAAAERCIISAAFLWKWQRRAGRPTGRLQSANTGRRPWVPSAPPADSTAYPPRSGWNGWTAGSEPAVPP